MDTDLFDRLGAPERMREIAGYDLLNPDLRTSLDEIAKRSATLLEAPVSLVSVVLDSSQMIIGGYGVSGWVEQAQGTPAEWAMCTHTVLAGQPYCVVDGTEDPKHAENPFLKIPDFTLVVAGDGSERGLVERAVDSSPWLRFVEDRARGRGLHLTR